MNSDESTVRPDRASDNSTTQVPGAQVAGTGDRAAYGAEAVAAVSGSISLYWALGGTLGIRTVGGRIAEMATSHAPGAALLAWGATLVKIIGVVFAIALARRPGWPLPRRPLLILGWLGAAVLTVYGALNMIGAALALTSSIDVGPDNDRYALSWHLGLWDPCSWYGASCWV